MNQSLKQRAMNEAVEALMNSGLMASCLNCEYFETRDICTKFNALPPPRVIVFSCGEHWVFSLPF